MFLGFLNFFLLKVSEINILPFINNENIQKGVEKYYRDLNLLDNENNFIHPSLKILPLNQNKKDIIKLLSQIDENIKDNHLLINVIDNFPSNYNQKINQVIEKDKEKKKKRVDITKENE